MAYTVPTCEPAQIEAGSSAYWDATYPDYPASDGWVLSYYIRGPVDLDIATVLNGSGWQVRVAGSDTDNLVSTGAYRLIGRVALSGEVHTVYNAPLAVLPNPATAVNAKSHARQMIEALEAVMVGGGAMGEYSSITVNGRTTQFRDRAELYAAHSFWKLQVAIEENPTGRVSHAAVFVRG